MFRDACRLLDHRSMVLRPGIEHIADLPLTHQNMLVTAYAAI
jgi:hypothetical protein